MSARSPTKVTRMASESLLLTNEGYSGPACATPRRCPKTVRRAMGIAARNGRDEVIRQKNICNSVSKTQFFVQAGICDHTFDNSPSVVDLIVRLIQPLLPDGVAEDLY